MAGNFIKTVKISEYFEYLFLINRAVAVVCFMWSLSGLVAYVLGAVHEQSVFAYFSSHYIFCAWCLSFILSIFALRMPNKYLARQTWFYLFGALVLCFVTPITTACFPFG